MGTDLDFLCNQKHFLSDWDRLNSGGVNAILLEGSFHRLPASIFANRTEKGDVCSLPAVGNLIALTTQGFARFGKIRHTNNMIDIDTAENTERFQLFLSIIAFPILLYCFYFPHAYFACANNHSLIASML